MIKTVTGLIQAFKADLADWDSHIKPWFRGESGNSERPLCPKISGYNPSEETFLMQSFRRQAGAFGNVPPRTGHTDLWLFLAQHHAVPTRLLDWTEGALHALYFALNRRRSNPRLYMLNPHKLNDLAGSQTDAINYPLSWFRVGGIYVALAWQGRTLDPIQQAQIDQIGIDFTIPFAFPGTYQNQRMIAQRSCFTVHGTSLDPLEDILNSKEDLKMSEVLIEYQIDFEKTNNLLKELSMLGVSAATIFPDLDHLTFDLKDYLEFFEPTDEHLVLASEEARIARFGVGDSVRGRADAAREIIQDKLGIIKGSTEQTSVGSETPIVFEPMYDVQFDGMDGLERFVEESWLERA